MVHVIIAGALIVAGVVFSQQAEVRGLPIDSSLIVPLWVAFILLGWLFFARGIWSDSWRKFTSPQTIVLKTEKTPFDIFVNAASSCLTQIFGGFVLIAVAAVSTGNGNLILQILQMILNKLVRILQVLFE